MQPCHGCDSDSNSELGAKFFSIFRSCYQLFSVMVLICDFIFLIFGLRFLIFDFVSCYFGVRLLLSRLFGFYVNNGS